MCDVNFREREVEVGLGAKDDQGPQASHYFTTLGFSGHLKSWPVN